MAFVGVDVSKRRFDVAWLRDAENDKVKTRVFDNTPDGFERFGQWLEKHTGQSIRECHVMMEATGIYHEALAYWLYEAGSRVYVKNPAHVRAFAKSWGRRSKNDRKDSVIIARFLESRRHRQWQPEPPEVRQLKALLSRLHALSDDIVREENRLEKARIQNASKIVSDSIRSMIRQLKAERERLVEQIDDHFDQHPKLNQDRKRLETIPGIGPALSREIIAIIRSRDFKKARELAAFVGTVPIYEDSGDTVRGASRLNKIGPGHFRAKLYMATVVAKQHNPSVKAHYERMRARGKAPMSALGAAMRKLVHIAFGVVKNQCDYQPEGALKTA